ncbi:MAG: RNA polymerase sigma-70 factor, partial [Muribaculaceae bacterium]|nr:RNA polymerase sigma-70 factor [Muribaculaceae bacterium]
MTKEVLTQENLLIAALKLDSHEAFVRIFRIYYSNLVMFCGQFVDDRQACEDIVQDVFVRLWEERHKLEIKRSLRNYLTALVQNAALDLLRHNKVKANYASKQNLQILALSPEEHMFYSELNEALNNAVDELNPKLRETLVLSMNDRLTYPQIAVRLGVSVRTVESRMSKALRLIREQLRIYKLPLMAAAILRTLNMLPGL